MMTSLCFRGSLPLFATRIEGMSGLGKVLEGCENRYIPSHGHEVGKGGSFRKRQRKEMSLDEETSFCLLDLL